MLGCHSGFQTWVKEKSEGAIGTPCTIYQQTLIVKTMPDELKDVLNYMITVVNFIKVNKLNFHLFAELCKETDSEFETLLLHSQVRWLLRVNATNLSLQGKEITMLHSYEKLTAFKMKLELWHPKLDRKNFASFSQLNMFIDENEFQKYSLYFPDLHDFNKYFCFIRNPFVHSISDLPTEGNLIQEQFIDLVNDQDAKYFFHEMCWSNFWIEMAQSYLDVAKMSLKVQMPFPTTY
uniref:Uncharacterized protein n=1 Tax=Octopus bimaculoides TaxID=37653 RepID=A0A0L8FVR7_OCTBM